MAAPKTAEEIKSEIFEWLEKTKYAATSFEPLSGGSANFIYRARLATPLEDGTTDVLVKHGEGYMAVAPANKISTERCQIEEECLIELDSFRIKADRANVFKYVVRTPKCYLYDDATHTQIQEYLPNGINLKEYILQNFSSPTPESLRLQCHQLGKALAQYITGFNCMTDPKLYTKLMKNHEMQDLKHMINYDWLLERIDQFPKVLGEAKDVFVKVKKQAMEESTINPEALAPIQGDLWPGNILLPNTPIQEGVEVPIFVIDWEQAQLGVPAQDHGEMIGESYAFWLYKKIDAGLWMMQGYIEGLGEQSETSAWRNAIQVGVHLLAFSTIAGWGTPEQIETVAGLARDIIVKAWNRDREWFKKSELACLFTKSLFGEDE